MVLAATLREALARLNPELPGEALGNAVRRLTHPEGATLEAQNRAFHRMVVDGVAVEYRDGGRVRGAQTRVIDFDDPAYNDWLAVNQFTVVENKIERRPDVVLFVNGLPLGVIELKNPTDADATIWTAWQQHQTYEADLPGLFSMNAALIVSDGLAARLGTLTAGREWFKPWRTIGGGAGLRQLNERAVKVLGDETLWAIACELVETVRNNVTIDWTMRENVRAKLRSYVHRILRRHGYPPDKQEKATQTVLEQAEALSAVWATAA